MAKSAAVLLGFLALCGGLWWFALASQREPPVDGPEGRHAPAGWSASADLAASRPNSAAAASRERLGPAAEAEPSGPARPAIRGTVTDEEGRPISGADVRAMRAGQPFQDGHSRSAADGSFVIEKIEKTDPAGADPVTLHVSDQAGYEPLHSGPVAWGELDARLVLRRGKTLEVELVDASDGTAVEPCGIGVVQSGRYGTFSQTVVVARPRPGVAWLAPVGVGRHVILVAPKDGSHARICHEAVLQGNAIQREVVRIPRAQRRPLEVLDAARRGVPGTVFDLVQLVDPDTKRAFPGAEIEAVRAGSFVQSFRIVASATDADGKSTLIAAPGQRYVLALSAPGRAQMVVRDVLVEAALGPLVVTLASGATLTGRIGPYEVIARMWRSDAELANGKVHRPALWLVPVEPAAASSTQGATGEGHIPLARDGSFTFSGVAEGSFGAFMYWYDDQGQAHHERLGVVRDLVAGERRELVISLEHLRRVELAGRVLLDGAPFAGQPIRLAGSGTDQDGEPRACVAVDVRTDEHGAFVASVEPGAWHVELPAKPRAERQWPRIHSDTLEVPPGRSARVTFQAHPLRLVVTLLDASGVPAAGQTVACRHERIGVVHFGKTDDRGTAAGEPLCAGKAELFWERPRQGPVGKGWPEPVAIGTVELRADRPVTAVTLRLPAAEIK